MTNMVKVEIYFENEEGTWSGVHEIDPDANFHEEMAKHTQDMDTKSLVYDVERVKGGDDAPFHFDPILDGKNIPLNASFEDAVGLPVHFISIHPKFHGMTDSEIEVAKDEAFNEMNRAKQKLDDLLNESARRDRENPTVKLILKDNDAPIHYVMTMPVDDTVLKLKMLMLEPKIGNVANWDAMDEREKMAYSAILKVFDKDGNQLDDLKKWSEILPFPLPQFFEVRVECIKDPDDVETLTKFSIHMMNTQVLYSVIAHNQLYDKIELNKKHKPEFYKGTLSVHCGDKVFYYHYGELETVGCLIDLLEEEYCLMFRGVQGVFKLRAGRSGSFLYDHEPLWANDYKTVEIVASFNGGGKSIRKDIKTTKRTPADFQKLYGDAFKEIAKTVKPIANMDCMSACDKALSKFNADAEKNAPDAFNNVIANMDEDMLDKLFQCLGMKGGTEYKLKQASRCMFGKALEELEGISKMTAGVLDSAEMVVLTAYYGAVSKGDFGIGKLRGAVKTALDKKIGAREARDNMET